VNPDLSYAEAEKKFTRENRPSSLIYRLAKPAEVANVVAFLASERAGDQRRGNPRRRRDGSTIA
jgi:3-oxoacyl-[acyl-carrier protein] reductase